MCNETMSMSGSTMTLSSTLSAAASNSLAQGSGGQIKSGFWEEFESLNINSTSCSATLPSRIRSSSRSDGIPRPPDDIPRQMFATMYRESNGSGINLNIGPPPSCAPPTPPKKSL